MISLSGFRGTEKNIFLKDKQFVEENEECFEIIFWNI
jgi:hypothetical protein